MIGNIILDKKDIKNIKLYSDNTNNKNIYDCFYSLRIASI